MIACSSAIPIFLISTYNCAIRVMIVMLRKHSLSCLSRLDLILTLKDCYIAICYQNIFINKLIVVYVIRETKLILYNSYYILTYSSNSIYYIYYIKLYKILVKTYTDIYIILSLNNSQQLHY